MLNRRLRLQFVIGQLVQSTQDIAREILEIEDETGVGFVAGRGKRSAPSPWNGEEEEEAVNRMDARISGRGFQTEEEDDEGYNVGIFLLFK